jgi:hypothetical protein
MECHPHYSRSTSIIIRLEKSIGGNRPAKSSLEREIRAPRKSAGSKLRGAIEFQDAQEQVSGI